MIGNLEGILLNSQSWEYSISLFALKFLSNKFNQSEKNKGKVVLTYHVQNFLSFQMDKKIIDMKIVEIYKMDNVNELQTCPFRVTEVIFSEFVSRLSTYLTVGWSRTTGHFFPTEIGCS